MNFEKIKDFFKEVKLIDWIIVAGIILAILVGFLTFLHFRQTASKKIEANSTIGFQVFLRGVTLTGPEAPMAVGDETFITIRNVPCTNLKVADIRIDTKKAILPPKNGKDPLVIEDVSQPFLYDMLITLIVDNAKITKDGAVVGGNKIKIGLPVTLEGPSYKLNGSVSDVRILQPKAENSPAQQNNQPQPNVNRPEENMS